MASATLSERLGEYAASVTFADLPEAVRRRTHELLWHQLGISLASHDVPLAASAVESVAEELGRGAATILHGGAKAAPTTAAFANGTLFHVRVEDDAHRTAHLGTTVIAAALASAEVSGCSGTDFLSAIVAGYEVGGLLNRRYGAESTVRGFRATGLYGVLAAAAAAARALGLTPHVTAHAIGLAAPFAGGLIEPFGAGSEDFPLQNGMAARNGVHAALLARAGVRAAVTALDGPTGFLAAFVGQGDVAVADELSEMSSLLEVNLKPLPVCAGNQVPIRNARRLRQRLDGRSTITAIEIRMNPFEATHPGIDNAGPFSTRTETLMSTQFCVALALTGSAIALADLENYDDPLITDLVQRSRIVADPRLEMLESEIRVTIDGGIVLEERLRVAEEEWHPSFAQISERMQNLAVESGISVKTVRAVERHVAGIDGATSVGTLVEAVTVSSP